MVWAWRMNGQTDIQTKGQHILCLIEDDAPFVYRYNINTLAVIEDFLFLKSVVKKWQIPFFPPET